MEVEDAEMGGQDGDVEIGEDEDEMDEEPIITADNMDDYMMKDDTLNYPVM